jgi:hypothetical protein
MLCPAAGPSHLHCIKAKYYPAQKSVIFHLGPDSIAMNSITTQWCFSQSYKMMVNALLVHMTDKTLI